MAQGAGTIGSGYSMQLGGLGNVLNQQTQMSMNAADNGIGAALGGIAGAAASVYTGSDIRLKENIEYAGVDELTGLNLYDFNYKWNSKRFRGVMAQEIKYRRV